MKLSKQELKDAQGLLKMITSRSHTFANYLEFNEKGIYMESIAKDHNAYGVQVETDSNFERFAVDTTFFSNLDPDDYDIVLEGNTVRFNGKFEYNTNTSSTKDIQPVKYDKVEQVSIEFISYLKHAAKFTSQTATRPALTTVFLKGRYLVATDSMRLYRKTLENAYEFENGLMFNSIMLKLIDKIKPKKKDNQVQLSVSEREIEIKVNQYTITQFKQQSASYPDTSRFFSDSYNQRFDIQTDDLLPLCRVTMQQFKRDAKGCKYPQIHIVSNDDRTGIKLFNNYGQSLEVPTKLESGRTTQSIEETLLNAEFLKDVIEVLGDKVTFFWNHAHRPVTIEKMNDSTQQTLVLPIAKVK